MTPDYRPKTRDQSSGLSKPILKSLVFKGFSLKPKDFLLFIFHVL